MMGMTGNTMLDNCTIDTAFEADSNLLRLRLLNGSKSRALTRIGLIYGLSAVAEYITRGSKKQQRWTTPFMTASIIGLCPNCPVHRFQMICYSNL
ncbi:hypothetical protein NYA22BAC_03543 (plasmid) [Parasphingorhabdus sp. NYA22]|jgi:hypothetical protein